MKAPLICTPPLGPGRFAHANAIAAGVLGRGIFNCARCGATRGVGRVAACEAGEGAGRAGSARRIAELTAEAEVQLEHARHTVVSAESAAHALSAAELYRQALQQAVGEPAPDRRGAEADDDIVRAVDMASRGIV